MASFLFQSNRSEKPSAAAGAGEEEGGPVCPDPEDSDGAAMCDIRAHSAGGEVQQHGGDPEQDRAGVQLGAGCGCGLPGPSPPSWGRGLVGWCLHVSGLFYSELIEIQPKLASSRNNLLAHVTETFWVVWLQSLPVQNSKFRKLRVLPSLGVGSLSGRRCPCGGGFRPTCCHPRGKCAQGWLSLDHPWLYPFLKQTQGQGYRTLRMALLAWVRCLPKRKWVKRVLTESMHR